MVADTSRAACSTDDGEKVGTGEATKKGVARDAAAVAAFEVMKNAPALVSSPLCQDLQRSPPRPRKKWSHS
jgi:hypothetical protein